MQSRDDVRAAAGQASPTRNVRYGLLVGVVLILVAIVLLSIVGWQPVSALGLTLGALLLIGVGIRSLRTTRARRVERALRAWGRDRGFLMMEAHGNPGTTPLLQRVGRLGPVLIGPINCDSAAILAHCATTAGGREDPQGDRFTVAIVRVPTETEFGLRIGTHQTWIDAMLDDWRMITTESLEIDERFRIEARDDHDPVLVRSLLEPTVLAAMLDNGPAVGVEIEDDILVVWCREHAGSTSAIGNLDVLRAQAERWSTLLCEAGR